MSKNKETTSLNHSMEILMANAIDCARQVCETLKAGLPNEAETRFKAIDEILINVLEWPKALIKVESKNNSGYSDYVLTDRAGRGFVVVEAKKKK